MNHYNHLMINLSAGTATILSTGTARFRTLTCKLLLVLSMAASLSVQSLESDREQQIEIESDSAEFRELEGITVYNGNVRMSQGSILLLADMISIYTADGNVSRLVATGDRAYYEQVPAVDQEKVVARGETIEYVLEDDIIHLIQQASLSQAGATLNANRITYDVRNSLLIGNRDTDSGERVKVVIPSPGPRSKPKQQSDSGQ